jgi:hypothetical protein
MGKGLFILGSVSNSYPPPPDCDATRGKPCSHKAGNVIETHEHNAISSRLKAFRRRQLYSRHQPANGIIKDFVFS